MTQTQIEAHVDTEWDFSNAVAPEYTPLSEGTHICHIEKASCDENKVISITLRDVENGECSVFKYYMLKKNFDVNEMTLRIMNGLKGALRGTNKGVLHPDDLVNGVVVAKVEPNTYEGKTMMKCNSFNPVSRSTLKAVATAYEIQPYQYVIEG